MHRRYRNVLLAMFALAGSTLAPAGADAALATGLIDRKFPTFMFCPVETRNGNLVSFVAPANGAVRITFAIDNFHENDPTDPLSRAFNDPHLDNIMVMTRAEWDAHQTACSENCFADAGQLSPAPTHASDAAALANVAFVELFEADPFATASPIWQGGLWDSASTAPTDDATGTNCPSGGDSGGGSLRLGTEGDGDVVVSTNVTVTGLAAGIEHVVIGWLFVRQTTDCGSFGLPDPCWAQLQIIVDETEVVPAAESTFGAVKAQYRAEP